MGYVHTVCFCMLCVSWAEHWCLEGGFVMMVLVHFECTSPEF